MPPLESMDRHQKAVLWVATGNTNRYGQEFVSDPVEITVRWVNRRSVGRDPQGNRVSLDASVVAARVIPLGSRMWEGELADFLGTGSAGDDTDVMYVRTSDVAKSLKGMHTRYEYGLSRNKDDTAG